MPAAKQTIKQRIHHYIAQHPGCSLYQACEAVAPKQHRRAEMAVAILWSKGLVKVESNILHNIAPSPV